MSLENLGEEVETAYADFGDELTVSIDRETRNELAVLLSTLDTETTDELIRRAIHMLFQTTVETGSLDLHLRREFDVTYDEYLSGMTFEEMTGVSSPPDNEDRRYQF